MDRREKILHGIDWKNQKGLEIGPLCKPIVSRVEAQNIIYLDYLSTEELREKYKSSPSIQNLVHVDYVANSSQPLNSLLKSELPFNYIIASHVIEHVPNPILWLRELYEILEDGGILGLAIPDKRFCFDYLRPLSTTSDWVHAYVNSVDKPSPNAVFSHIHNAVHYHHRRVWGHKVQKSELKKIHTLHQAFQQSKKAAEGEYIDIHSWVLTPPSFFDIFKDLIKLDLFKFQVNSYYETTGHEFFVSLRKSADSSQKNLLSSIPTIAMEEVEMIKNSSDSSKQSSESFPRFQVMLTEMQNIRSRLDQVQQNIKISKNIMSQKSSIQRVYIRGCPHSGNTLMLLLCEVGFNNSYALSNQEIPISEKSIPNKITFGTFPSPEVHLDKKVQAEHFLEKEDAAIIFMIRDPRDVLISEQRQKLDQLGMTDLKLWIDNALLLKEIKQHQRVICIRYEDLVIKPNEIQEKIANTFGFDIAVPFSEAWRYIQEVSPNNIRSLKGIRPLEESRISYWKINSKYKDIIHKNLSEIPDILFLMKELNYEIKDEDETHKLRVIPWLTEDAIEFLIGFFKYKPSAKVLEFGMGGSTIWMSKLTPNLTSVEHNDQWFNKINDYISNNKYCHAVDSRLLSRPYSTICQEFSDDYFDLILVDGRDRVKCVEASMRVLKPGGYLMLDNAERKYYQKVYDLLSEWNFTKSVQNKPDSLEFYYPNWQTNWWYKPTSKAICNPLQLNQTEVKISKKSDFKKAIAESNQTIAKLGIGIITYHRLEHLKNCIERLRNLTTIPYYLVVADDGSSDETVEWCSQQKIPVVTGQNQGVVWNKNRALYALMNYTDADTIVLLEDDCWPISETWAQEWCEAVNRWHHLNFAHPGLLKRPGAIRAGTGNPGNPYQSMLVTGQCTGCSRHAMDSVGYLDTRFQGYGHGHVEWTRRFIRGNLSRVELPGIDKSRMIYLCITGGLESHDAPTYCSQEELQRNQKVLQSILDEPVYRNPWKNEEEKQKLLSEVEQAVKVVYDNNNVSTQSLPSSSVVVIPVQQPQKKLSEEALMKLQTDACIRDVIKLVSGKSTQIVGCHLDEPRKGYDVDISTFKISGWVIGRVAKVVEIELLLNSQVIQTIQVGKSRPDVGRVYPQQAGSQESGFVAQVTVDSELVESELLVQACLENQNRVPLYLIRLAKSNNDRKTVSRVKLEEEQVPGTIENSPEGRSTYHNLIKRIFVENPYVGFDPNEYGIDSQGWNSRHRIFAEVISEIKPAIIIEVGVWKGQGSIHMANLAKRENKEALVIAVDTWLGSPEHWNPSRPDGIFSSLKLRYGYPQLYYQFLSNVVLSGLQQYIIPIPQTSVNAAIILARLNIKAEIIHIDAGHEFESVYSDLITYWKLLKPGGVLIGDDVQLPGVKEALKKFCSEHNLNYIEDWPKYKVLKNE